MQKGTKVLRAEAIPFILINQKKDENNKITYEFELQRKAVDVFMAIKNKKIAVATVAGPQRSGKSFLSNRLLKRMTGFAIGPSTMPCTKGLWIWGEPVQVSQDTVLIIMDTEGLNSVQRDINVDLKIFSLSILLSSVFIYNSLGHIDERALENMSYVLRISENIRIKSEAAGDSDLSKCFPFFYWVLRDFSLDLKGMTEHEYLEKALMPVSNDDKDPKNQIRAKIRKLFTQRKCQCFPRPINDEDRLAHIEDLHFQDLREKFRDKMKDFERVFYETLPPKLINGKPLTGQIYLNLVRQYLDAINHGKVPEVLTSLERVLESQARQITEHMMTGYREAMSKVFLDKPTDQNIIERNHRAFSLKIQMKLDEKLKNWLDVGRTGQYKIKLLQSLEKDFKERLKKNYSLCTEQCANQFTKFSNSFYQLPKMENLDFIDNFFKEKTNEYNKNIKTYFEACKAPRKYLYFMEKFPKATMEYFELFFARARGLFNTEISKLKADNRNANAQIESLKRTLKQHENLMDQKQKEVDAITYEKDTLRREFEKNEKMKQFQKEAEKMSKNEIKKTLESYKLNLIELEHRNEELEEQCQRMKNDISRKNIQMEHMVKKPIGFEPPSESTEANTNLPNDLVSILTSLKEKMVSVKQFYDTNVPDDSLEDNMLRQIEQQRVQKYKQIEKMKEKHNTKIAELRERFNKTQLEYDKNIKLMNMHIDDLKTQNMDLQQELNQLSDKKGGNFNSERKNLEESLRLKQNNINSLKALMTEKDKKIGDLEYNLASMSSSLANFESYRQTFPYILNQLLNCIEGKTNKLKHSIKTLTNDDEHRVKDVFKKHPQLGIQI